MSTIKVGSISVIVRGLVKNNNLDYFQRSVPKDLWERLGKKLIRIRLDSTQNLIVQCSRLNERYDLLFESLRSNAGQLYGQSHKAALALLEDYQLHPGDGLKRYEPPSGHEGTFDDQPHLNDFENRFLKAELFHPEYLGQRDIPKVALDAMALLRRSPNETYLSEAFDLYIENHKRKEDSDFVNQQITHWKKLIQLVGNISITELNRQHAKLYRDTRLAQNLTPASVQREINTVKAIINSAFKELSLNLSNPFGGLNIPQSNIRPKQRQPYTHEEWKLLVNAAISKDDEIRRIFILLAHTGARLSEIVALRRVDVDLAEGSISLEEHSKRRLKNKGSARVIPLIKLPLETILRQLAETDSEYVFPRYMLNEKVSNDSASAALNKWSRYLVPVKSMHSLRHTAEDLLRDVQCPQDIQNEICGWAKGKSMASHYGKGYSLKIKREWLEKAFAPLCQ